MRDLWMDVHVCMEVHAMCVCVLVERHIVF